MRQPDLVLTCGAHFYFRMFAGNTQRRLAPFLQRNDKLIVSEYMVHHILNAPRRHQISMVHDPDAVAHLGKLG